MEWNDAEDSTALDAPQFGHFRRLHRRFRVSQTTIFTKIIKVTSLTDCVWSCK